MAFYKRNTIVIGHVETINPEAFGSNIEHQVMPFKLIRKGKQKQYKPLKPSYPYFKLESVTPISNNTFGFMGLVSDKEIKKELEATGKPIVKTKSYKKVS